MAQDQIHSSTFIHKTRDEGPSSFLQIFLRPGDPKRAMDEVAELKAKGLDLNAPAGTDLEGAAHDPRSAFTQVLATGDAYSLRGIAQLGARPAKGENIAAAFPLTEVRFGDQIGEGHGSDRFLMARQDVSERLIRAMEAGGVDFSSPIEGAPAGHAWARAAVEAEGFAHDDPHGRAKTTRFLTSLARAGVDFSEKDAEGRDARAVAAELVAQKAGPIHPDWTSAQEIEERASYFDGALEKAQAQSLSRDEAVRAAATRKSDQDKAAWKKPARNRAGLDIEER